MSAPVVSYEVWNNGMLAASRFDALATRALALCEQLSEVATRFGRGPEISTAKSSRLGPMETVSCQPPSVIFLLTVILPSGVTKVQETHYQEYSREEAEERARGTRKLAGTNWAEYLKAEGVSSGLAKRVARLLRSGERVSSDLAERVAKDLKAQGVFR